MIPPAADAQERRDPSVTVADLMRRLSDAVARVIVGKESEVVLALTALLANGHVLVDDVPGVGKTMLVKAIGRATGCSVGRIQLTPDLLPADITGVDIWDPSIRRFEFRPGPIFANLVLADEINRATPKTQSALLEAMEERQVSVAGVTHPLPEPFLILATENPVELMGTFPLPETELDRFLMRLSLGYLQREDEARMVERFTDADPLAELVAVSTPEELCACQRDAATVHCAPAIVDYAVRLVQRTRTHRDVALGASPRASLGLVHCAQVRAAAAGRRHVLPDDVQALVQPVVAHRLVLHAHSATTGTNAAALLRDIVESEPVPSAPRRLW